MARLFMARWEVTSTSTDPWHKDLVEGMASLKWGREVRIYSGYFGNTRRVLVEWDFESLDDYQKTMNGLGGDPTFIAGWKKLSGLTSSENQHSELWWRRNP